MKNEDQQRRREDAKWGLNHRWTRIDTDFWENGKKSGLARTFALPGGREARRKWGQLKNRGPPEKFVTLVVEQAIARMKRGAAFLTPKAEAATSGRDVGAGLLADGSLPD
jgi:hypothetical protein